MKKLTFLSLILLFFISSSAKALTWSSPFVVWDGKVYEIKHELKDNSYVVKQELILDEDVIGNVIGKVTSRANDHTGEYHGNASNEYPVGTKYYEIKGISTSTAIALKDDNQWVKAVYKYKAQKDFDKPTSIKSLFINPYFIFGFIILLIVAYLQK